MAGPTDADGAESTVRAYYDALDSHEYEALTALLAPDFVQRRPDRTFEGREAFVRFMREERPNAETSHDLASVLSDGDGDAVAVRGRVVDGEGTLFSFADHFALAGGRIVRLETYTR